MHHRLAAWRRGRYCRSADADAGIDTEADTGGGTDVFDEDAPGDREPGETEPENTGLEIVEEGGPEADSSEASEQ